MINRFLKTGLWLLVLLIVWLLPGEVQAVSIGDARREVEIQDGAADFVQDETKRLWTRQEWQTGTHGKAVAYGYLRSIGDWRYTRWLEYNARGKVAKVTVLFGSELRVREFGRYFGDINAAITKDSGIVFTNRFLAGDSLGAVVQAGNGRLNYIQFLTVPDGTKINMHTKVRGFMVTEIKPQEVKRHFADKTWRETDNCFKDALYFSEALAVRKVTDRIVIHHTAVEDMSVADIHAMHLAKGWAGVGYHKVILPDGTVADGRPEGMTGAHAKGGNASSIGVALVGNFDSRAPSAAQLNSLVELVYTLMGKYHIPPENILPHRAVTEGTSCPGKQFPWDELMQRLKEKAGDF